jgi:hypothetical protein
MMEHMNEINEEVLAALRLMIENDNTEQYLDAHDGEAFNPDDENAHWLEVLQKAQEAYYNATGDRVPNDMNVLLV